jgi:hypothetical protein
MGLCSWECTAGKVVAPPPKLAPEEQRKLLEDKTEDLRLALQAAEKKVIPIVVSLDLNTENLQIVMKYICSRSHPKLA